MVSFVFLKAEVIFFFLKEMDVPLNDSNEHCIDNYCNNNGNYHNNDNKIEFGSSDSLKRTTMPQKYFSVK